MSSRSQYGVLNVEYTIPHSDIDHLHQSERQRLVDNMEVLEFGHTLEDQIGGQLSAGFHLTGFFEDRYNGSEDDPISAYMDTFIATRAIKP